MTTLKNGTLPDLVEILRSENARAWDVVVPSSKISMDDAGLLTISHDVVTPATIDENGVTPESTTTETAVLAPTQIAHDDLADRLDIHRTYYGKCKATAPALLATNVNHWLGESDARHYVRCLRGDDDGPGIVRCIRSDKFRAIDNLDVTMATLSGVRAAGVDPSRLQIAASLTDERMHIRITCPDLTHDLGTLIERYRRPDGGTGHQAVNDLVAAGLEIRNSDVGRGAYLVAPRIVVLRCSNGMTITKDAQRAIHVGSKQDEGLIDWSDETMRRHLALIESKTTDAVRLFLSPGYLEKVVDEIRGVSSEPLDNPMEVVETVTKKLRYSDAEQASILDAFVKGGDLTPFGVAQAFTWVAQSADVARSAEMEDDAWRAMELAAAAR